MGLKLRIFLELVKFEHTIFALPFAYMGTFLAARGWPEFATFAWVTLAMVGARTAGMCFNRLIDLTIDAKNPRTQDRPLVVGTFSKSVTWIVAALGLSLLAISAWQLNPLAFGLFPIAAFLLFGYSYSKRFTSFSHLALGTVLSCAPVGGWIAYSGSIALPPLLLGGAVILWVAGFDILYALQDIEVDKQHGLYSIPSRYGVSQALVISAVFHIATWGLLFIAGWVGALGMWYDIGLGLFAALLVYQHWIIRPDDLSRLNAAFFTANGAASILIFFFTAIDLWVQ